MTVGLPPNRGSDVSAVTSKDLLPATVWLQRIVTRHALRNITGFVLGFLRKFVSENKRLSLPTTVAHITAWQAGNFAHILKYFRLRKLL